MGYAMAEYSGSRADRNRPGQIPGACTGRRRTHGPHMSSFSAGARPARAGARHASDRQLRRSSPPPSMLPGDVAQILLGQAATAEAVAGLRDRDASRRPGDPALPALARRAASRRSRHLLCQRACPSPTLIGGAARQHAQARRHHRAGRGAPGAVARHHRRDVARLGSTTGWSTSLVDRHHLGAGIHGRDPRRAASSPSSCAGCRRSPSPSGVIGLLDVLRAYAMPVITLTFVISAQMIRMTRAAVIETL